MPLDTQVLTRHGWLNHDEVGRPGDETIGYNPSTGHSEWTPVTAVHHHGDAPLVRLSCKTWSAVCTLGHRWAASHVYQIDGRRADGHGGRIAGKSTSYRVDESVTTDKITSRHSLRLAAPASTGDGPGISDGEAELLGWVMGDGSVAGYDTRQISGGALGEHILRVAREDPEASNRAIARIVGCTHQTVGAYLRANGDVGRGAHPRTGTGSMTRISLLQAKPQGVTAIEALLAREGIPFSRHVRSPSGIARLPATLWQLRASYSAGLLKRSQYDHRNPVPFVLSLSESQRAAFLRGVFGAEGYQGAPQEAFGRGPYEAAKIYCQADGPSQDAITLAIYLSGKRPAFHPWSASSRAGLGSSSGANIGETKAFISGGHIRAEDAGHAAVFCLTTGLSTWTARQGRQAWLTGNSPAPTDRRAQHGARPR